MASDIKQRLRRYNGTDYDSIYLSPNVGDAIGTLSTSHGGTGNTSVDTTPTSGSSKMCTSGGIYTEINNLKTSVSEGKTAIASAITDKGVSTASDASFSTMATNIGSINTRTDGTLNSNSKLLSGYTAYGSGGTKYTGSISSKGATTYTPTTTNQTISSGYYLSGTQTIKGDTNLVAANIKSGVSIFGVAGSLVTGKKVAFAHQKGNGTYITISNLTFEPHNAIGLAWQATSVGVDANSVITAFEYLPTLSTQSTSYNGCIVNFVQSNVLKPRYIPNLIQSFTYSNGTLTITRLGSAAYGFSTTYYYDIIIIE